MAIRFSALATSRRWPRRQIDDRSSSKLVSTVTTHQRYDDIVHFLPPYRSSYGHGYCSSELSFVHDGTAVETMRRALFSTTMIRSPN
ncbi:hypothetical protein M6B38_317125 [Iris pallida]|uniref:Uncharacterized protein n=1 Tax=Iris pallida TaxID=29817 RepID=A0AAX6HFS7_IRIPA|nr:hypothetical protein M6B38_317125 [Iris pallida]